DLRQVVDLLLADVGRHFRGVHLEQATTRDHDVAEGRGARRRGTGYICRNVKIERGGLAQGDGDGVFGRLPVGRGRGDPIGARTQTGQDVAAVGGDAAPGDVAGSHLGRDDGAA